MSIFSFSSPNTSDQSSIINIFFFIQKCSTSSASAFTIFPIIGMNYLFLLPVCILVLHHGLQCWRQQCSCTTQSHSDLITYHIVFANLLSIIGSVLFCCGVNTDIPQLVSVGIYLWSSDFSGQMFFHILTCVERYLAVVHPVTYLSLKKTKGIRMRNITIGCAWLLCIVRTSLMAVTSNASNVLISISTMSVSLFIISFCSLSVLRVLIRPGPGERGGGRRQVDQSKLRAFYTIMIILGVLLIRFGGTILSVVLNTSLQLEEPEICYVLYFVFWLSLPSSLVSPLLFLYKTGKLVCCKNNNTSGQGSD